MMVKETETETTVSITFDDDGTQKVVFNPSKMSNDKLYPFAYRGELWTLKKCYRTISIMKFCTDTGVN